MSDVVLSCGVALGGDHVRLPSFFGDLGLLLRVVMICVTRLTGVSELLLPVLIAAAPCVLAEGTDRGTNEDVRVRLTWTQRTLTGRRRARALMAC